MKKLTITATILAALLAATPVWAEIDATGKDKQKHEKKSEEAEARAEEEDNLYDEATDALDEHDYKHAIEAFREVVKMQGEHADAAMYWTAYAQNKTGNRSDALATILQFQKAFPKSRWMEDAKALEVEVRNSSGQQVEPRFVVDEETKMIAIQSLMNTDPERAMPILEKIITSPTQSPKLKDKAIFVLSQSGSPRAAEVLGRIARDNGNRDLQSRALRYLGIMGGEWSRKTLADVYQSSPDVDVKKSILRSFMVSGDRAHLLALAKTETNPELRAEAVQQLGVSGAKNELADLYLNESSIGVKKKILQAMFVGGSVDKLSEIARAEHNPELRATAIRNLGLAGGSRSATTLVQIYETDSNPEIRRSVINALFLQGNARSLIELARKEKDPDMKKAIISKLSIMGSKEATDYLMEFLKE